MTDPDYERDAPVPGAHVARSSGDNEWYTPAEYTQAARRVMGDIDLDPASSDVANNSAGGVGAFSYFTEADDGLAREWKGRVWMNPPHARSLISRFCEKLAASVDSGTVAQAVVLVNNATETRWGRRLIDSAAASCFPTGRIRFWHPEKESATPLQGQAIYYFGPNADAFCLEFARFGGVCKWVQPAQAQ